MGLLGTVKDAAIEWVVQGILESLFTEKMEAWSRDVDLDGDVENLKSAMRFINTVVDAARWRKLQNEGISRSLRDLKQLLYDAEDVMDELDYYRLQREIEGGNGDGSAAGTHPVGDRASSSTWYSVAWNAAKQMVDLALLNHRKRKREDDTLLALESKHDVSQRINKIANQLRTAGDDVHRVLQLEISPTNAMPYQPRNTRLTTSMQVEPKVYGRDAERNKVVELLINEKYSDLRVLPIVGGGGVGKTTLARFVCDDQRIRSHFDLQMWVCVSTVFDEVRLTREILEHACKEDGQDYGKISCFDVLQDILLKNIRNKRFLLVLDDIWEDKDKIGWVNLLAPLKRNQVPGCMILATTRSKSVAKMIGTMDVVEMKGLDEEDFWLLFEACAFGNENCTDHPTLHTIGQQIAKTLKGYPLAAQSVGALLKENLSSQHWQDVQETWKSRQENDGDILPILELSYDYLPPDLQHCFSYCSLFPEDHRFNGETLVRAWISQNFVQSKDTSKRLEEEGMQYLYKLMDLGFFQKVGSHYVMHDLMHELAEKVSSNDCATINGSKSKTIQPSVRHVSIITTAYDKDEHCNFPSEKFENILRTIGSLKKLRTLMFFGLSSVNLLRTRSFQSLCKEIESLRLLRIYVTGADIDSVDNFTKLYHLRCLEFMYAPSNNVFASGNQEDIAFPQALTRLYHLQVLGFDGIWGNPTVPTHMNNLVNLRHLFANEKVHSTIPSIGNMTSLQELRVFRVQNACGFEIKQLQSMNKLVQLGISQLGNVKTKEEASQAKLIDKEHLEMLWLSWDDSGMSLEPTTEGTRDVHVLEGLRPNQNLKYLHITGYSGATSPTWLDSNVSVTSLKTLHLEKCKGWQILPSLEMLPLLRELTLISMWNLNQIIIPLEGMRSLKELKLVDMNYLKELSFPSLEKMELIQMSSLESCISTNMAAQKEWPSSLRELMIQDCPLLIVLPVPPSTNTRVSVKKVSTLPTMETDYCQGFSVKSSNVLTVLDESMLTFQNLRDITKLQIKDCPNLVSLSFGGFRQLINLRALEIIKCGNLLSSYTIPGDIHEDSRAQANCPLLPSLTHLKSQSCGIAGKWVTKMLPDVQSLEELYLEDCPQIKSISIYQPRQEEESSSLASSSECLAVATTCLAQDEYLLYIPLNVLLSLKIFSIGHCPELQFCGRKEWFGAFVSLTELSILSCPELLSSADERFSLPSSLIKLWIQHLRTKLQPYFPDSQTSLRQLEVGESPNLKSLRLESCTSLEKLAIWECEQQAVLEGLQFLRSLRILKIYTIGLKSLWLESCTALKELEIRECEQLAVLEGLQFLRSLRILKIYTVGLKSLRLESCTALEELLIRGCKQQAVLEGLQYLGSLRSLAIQMNSELSAVWDRGSQEQNERSDHARLLPPSVKVLEIYDLREEILPCFLPQLSSLPRLVVSESPNLTSLQLGSCTALVTLKIRDCKSLNSLNSLQSLGNLTDLEVLRCPRVQIGGYELCHRLERVLIDDPSALTTSFCEHLTSLQGLRISMDGVTRQLTDEQEEALQLLTSLRELFFGYCSNLVDLPAGLHSLPSLKRLKIHRCEGISRLPEKGLPPSLEELDIFWCSEELNAHCRMLATSKLKVTTNCKSVN